MSGYEKKAFEPDKQNGSDADLENITIDMPDIDDSREEKRKRGFLPWLFGKGNPVKGMGRAAGRAASSAKNAAGGVRGAASAARGAAQGAGRSAVSGLSKGATGASAAGRSMFNRGILGAFRRSVFASRAGIAGMLVTGAAIGAGIFMFGDFMDKKDAYTQGLFEASSYSDSKDKAEAAGLERKADRSLGYFNELNRKLDRDAKVENENLGLNASDANLVGVGEETPVYEDPAQEIADNIAGEGNAGGQVPILTASSGIGAGAGAVSGYGGGAGGANADGYNLDKDGINTNKMLPMSRAARASSSAGKNIKTRGGASSSSQLKGVRDTVFKGKRGAHMDTKQAAMVTAYSGGKTGAKVLDTGKGMENAPVGQITPSNPDMTASGGGGGGEMGEFSGGGGGSGGGGATDDYSDYGQDDTPLLDETAESSDTETAPPPEVEDMGEKTPWAKWEKRMKIAITVATLALLASTIIPAPFKLVVLGIAAAAGLAALGCGIALLTMGQVAGGLTGIITGATAVVLALSKFFKTLKTMKANKTDFGVKAAEEVGKTKTAGAEKMGTDTSGMDETYGELTDSEVQQIADPEGAGFSESAGSNNFDPNSEWNVEGGYVDNTPGGGGDVIDSDGLLGGEGNNSGGEWNVNTNVEGDTIDSGGLLGGEGNNSGGDWNVDSDADGNGITGKGE